MSKVLEVLFSDFLWYLKYLTPLFFPLKMTVKYLKIDQVLDRNQVLDTMCVWVSHPFFENLGVGITKISMGFLHGTFFFWVPVTSVFSRIRGFWLTGGHRAKKCIFFFSRG